MEGIKFSPGKVDKDTPKERPIFIAYTPYHPGFIAKAKQLNGKWSEKLGGWYFDPRDESEVRRIVEEVYGYNELEMPDLVQVVITLVGDGVNFADDCFICGRQVARRAYRDYAVKLGDGVIVIKGAFPRSGGSSKYPRLLNNSSEQVTLLVRDVPRKLAEREVARYQDVKIFETDVSTDTIRRVLEDKALFGTK